MSTICGIDLDLLKQEPAAADVARLVAGENSIWQAKFFDDLARSMTMLCKSREMQISYVAFKLLEHEEGKQLVRDLAWWLENEEKKQAEEEAAQ